MSQPSSMIEVDIEKPAAGGRMIARHEGRIVLVSGAIPGERVRARVERVQRGVVFAEVVGLLQASTDRRMDGGDHACGGNTFAHIALPRQRALKAEIVADAFARIGRMPLTMPVVVLPSPDEGYRMRARAHVQGTRLGFFREGTHQLCEIGATRQLLPDSVDLLGRLAQVLAQGDPIPIEAVSLAENVPADGRALHLELLAPVPPPRLRQIAGLPGVTGLSAAIAQARTTTVVAGSPFVTDRLDLMAGAGEASRVVSLRRHVRSFFQGNRFLLDALVDRVVRHAPAGPVVDLYAGVGLFAVALAARGVGPVTAVEGDPIGGDDLHANAAPYGQALEAHTMPVERYLKDRRSADAVTVVVDPPRTGLSPEALDGVIGLLRAGGRRLVYVSCDPATLARDARALTASGLALSEIEALDLFPNTAHIETICVFDVPSRS